MAGGTAGALKSVNCWILYVGLSRTGKKLIYIKTQFVKMGIYLSTAIGSVTSHPGVVFLFVFEMKIEHSY